MSGVSAHGWRLTVAALWLAGLASGCHVPPASSVSPIQLTSSGPSSAGDLAAGLEPLPPGSGPAARGTVLPPAGVGDSPPKQENEGFDWSQLAPSAVYSQIKKAVGLGPDERIARAAYKEGEALYRQKKFQEAADRFATAADRWPDTPLEEDALFMLAESQFFSDQYAKALDTYGKLMKKHDYSRYLEKAAAREFALGRYWEQIDAHQPHWPTTPNFTDRTRPLFDTWGHAIKAYESVCLTDPTGPLADDAVMASGNAYFVKGRYEDAAEHYDRVRRDYPKSEHFVQASVLGMKSKQEMYQGPMYDGKPLDEAAQIADLSLAQFPDRLGPEKDRMLRARNQMTEQKAERQWTLGQYYDKRRYYGAARFYYQSLMREYPQTQFARQAKQRYDQIKDWPASPPNYFQWIEDVLPSKRKY